MSNRAMFLLAAGLALAVPNGAQAQPSTAASAADTGVPVHEDGLVATWYPPASGKPAPVILALGGSEGGEAGGQLLASALAKQGYAVLALAYFKADGLPETLEEIPLGYFSDALDWIKRQPLADTEHIGIYGVSIGAETALEVAAHHPEIGAVVAGVPSSVVWQGYDPEDYTSVKSTYSIDGEPVPYLAYDTSKAFTGVYDLYARSLVHRDAHPEAIIPVEQINGAVLLLSAKDDQLWPSTEMADQVMQRLDAEGFDHPHRHIAYADAGHGAMLPPHPGAKDSALANIGGTETGNAAAREAMWSAALSFLASSLGAPES